MRVWIRDSEDVVTWISQPPHSEGYGWDEWSRAQGTDVGLPRQQDMLAMPCAANAKFRDTGNAATVWQFTVQRQFATMEEADAFLFEMRTLHAWAGTIIIDLPDSYAEPLATRTYTRWEGSDGAVQMLAASRVGLHWTQVYEVKWGAETSIGTVDADGNAPDTGLLGTPEGDTLTTPEGEEIAIPPVTA
jgi:hypothetical protein